MSMLVIQHFLVLQSIVRDLLNIGNNLYNGLLLLALIVRERIVLVAVLGVLAALPRINADAPGVTLLWVGKLCLGVGLLRHPLYCLYVLLLLISERFLKHLYLLRDVVPGEEGMIRVHGAEDRQQPGDVGGVVKVDARL